MSGAGLPDDGVAARWRVVAERTAWLTGPQFFRELVASLATAIDVPCALVAELVEYDRFARPLACWCDGQLRTLGEYAIAGTPSAAIQAGEVVTVSDRLSDRFPLGVLGAPAGVGGRRAESCLVAPARSAQGLVIGYVAVVDERARHWTDADLMALRTVGARTGHEIEGAARLRARDRTDDGARLASNERQAATSHELRTLLNGILGYAQLLARDPGLDPRHVAAVAGMRQCGERLLGLVDSVAAAPGGAYVEEGRLEVPSDRPVDLLPSPRPASPEPELSPALRARLLEHSRRGDIAALTRCLDELEQQGKQPHLLAELRAHARVFDMRAIRGRLSRAD